MNALTITIGTIGVLFSLVCWYFFATGVLRMVNIIRIGQPDPTRNGPVVPRLKQMVVEFVAHTRMNRIKSVGYAHWFVMWGFLIGSLAWFEAYGETFNPEFHWPIFGDDLRCGTCSSTSCSAYRHGASAS